MKASPRRLGAALLGAAFAVLWPMAALGDPPAITLDAGCREAIRTFDGLRAQARRSGKAPSEAEANRAAECAYRLVDRKIAADLEAYTFHNRYSGPATLVEKSFTAELARARRYSAELESIMTRYESRPWSIGARARQGALFDRLATELRALGPPDLRLYTPAEQRHLDRFNLVDWPSTDDTVEDDVFRMHRREQWRAARDKMLDLAERPAVRFYLQSLEEARALGVYVRGLDAARRRLALYGEQLGEARMRAYTADVTEPSTGRAFMYREGMFQRTRPGMLLAGGGEIVPDPAP